MQREKILKALQILALRYEELGMPSRRWFPQDLARLCRLETPTDTLRKELKAYLTVFPEDPPEEVMNIMDSILQEEYRLRPVVDWHSVVPLHPGSKVAIWQGDITLLLCDAITNAANKELLGCFDPSHMCIDNVIHTWAGPRLRAACRRLMIVQGSLEPPGLAKATPGFNLPARRVLHTVGPCCTKPQTKALAKGRTVPEISAQLRSCYTHCLDEATKKEGCRTVALCCISTGLTGTSLESHSIGALLSVCLIRPFWLPEPASLSV